MFTYPRLLQTNVKEVCAAGRAAIAAVSVCGLLACGGGDDPPPDIFQANGANAAAIQSVVDSFRDLLGANQLVGPASATGRREVNWDAIPLARLDPFPGDFFVSTSPRGVHFATPGTRLVVSGDPGSPSFKFANITAQQWGLVEFGFFSPSRIFATIGSTITDVTFRVPGTQTSAVVKSFGVVLVDVDAANVSKVEFFDASNRLLLSRAVEPFGVQSQGLSFVGVRFNGGQMISRVRITVGTHPIDAPFQSPPPDGVAIDDVIFSEPQPNQ